MNVILDNPHPYDVIIHPGPRTEEAILTIGESRYGKYKILDMVVKNC